MSGGRFGPVRIWRCRIRSLRCGYLGSVVGRRIGPRPFGRRSCALLDEVLADVGIQVVLSGFRMPRMNAVMERWVATCRRQLLGLDADLEPSHLLHAVREIETHYNLHRPHRLLGQSAPLQPAPVPITGRAEIVDLDVRRRDRLGGTLHEYERAA